MKESEITTLQKVFKRSYGLREMIGEMGSNVRRDEYLINEISAQSGLKPDYVKKNIKEIEMV